MACVLIGSNLKCLRRNDASLTWGIICWIMVLGWNSVCCQNSTLSATDTPAYFTSEGYPTQYSNNVTYTWLLESSDPDEMVVIEVVDCEIEYVNAKVPVCQLDRLTIYDGEYDNATELYSSCCITSVPTMNSSSTFLLIKFYTDATVVARGFRVKYYNTGATTDVTSVAAASGLFIAVGIVVVLLLITAAIVTYFIYRLKCQDGGKPRVNPVGKEEESTEGQEPGLDNPSFQQDECKKRPLEGPECSVPPPKMWSEDAGMKDPQLEVTERNIFAKGTLLSTLDKPKSLPPLKHVIVPTMDCNSRSLSPVG